ncbi:hypothetical protein CTA2_4082 [Colletotrichum tanaceti]|uniref:Plasma membrane proteolipid 3 n=1 Tax=Colletotrichum tanaceti TaxID=1306861 RepID=A0A4U6XPW2_9PEZI|nr:hypothetical protein CTA2_4082 [Colletotrichum tanaceti]TKW57850.1 hypothetical protein CTA1_9787 [Colletotrichum tanaceti]
MASSTGIPSSPSRASKSASLRSLWSDTQSNLTRLLRASPSRSPPSSGRSPVSRPSSAIRFEISLPQRPGVPAPRCCSKGTFVAIACPPLAVYRMYHDWNDGRVWLAVALTLGGWIPGVVYALLVDSTRPTSPYYWHTAERSSSVAAKGPSRRPSKPSRKMVCQAV